ncbi:MAG: chitinase, Glycoside Hydrolase Family 18-like protein [Ramlibacter sp.]|nr:chitinase, Glycoside Hydrolase Family 18-like protein [Ramlibacter sp.]
MAAPASPALPSGPGLPSQILACYFTAWDTSYPITDVPLDFNVIYLFHARPQGPLLTDPVGGFETYNNTGDGTFYMPNMGESQISADKIQQVRARGQKVLLTVGGSSAGFNFDTRSKSENFVKSFMSIYAALGGVDGIDFNNFEGGIGSTPSEMIWICQQLIAQYGSNFAVTCPPNPDAQHAPGDRTLTAAMSEAGVLTYAAPQYYDYSGFKPANTLKNYTDQWVAHLGDASKVAVGFSANYDYTNALTLDECLREWNAIKAAHPTIRGMFCWNAQTNISGGNQWGSTMKPLVLG